MDAKIIVSLSLSQKVLATIKKMAQKDRRSLSNYVDGILTQHAEKANQ